MKMFGIFSYIQCAFQYECFFLKVLDGSVITAKRTAAVSAIATKVWLLFPKSGQNQLVVLHIK